MRILVLLILSMPLMVQADSPEDGRLTQEDRDRILVDITNRLTASAYVHGSDFHKWQEHLERHRVAINRAVSHRDFGEAVNRALREFGTSHVYLKTPTVVREAGKGRRVGVGIGSIPLENGLLAGFVIRHSPAWKSGLRRGDLIRRVDDLPATAPHQLSGPSGIPLGMSWERGGKTYQELVVPGPYPGSTPDSMTWLDEDIALIRIHSFRNAHYKRKQIEGFFKKARLAEGIILDLRGNLGGNIKNTYHLAGQVMSPKQPMLWLAFRSDYERFRKARPVGADNGDLVTFMKNFGRLRYPIKGKYHRKPYTGPLVVLVDSLSGSGGELFPAAVAEAGRAVVVGARTRGYVLLSSSFSLAMGYKLQIPIGEVITWKGTRIEGQGFKPDRLLSHRQTADDSFILSVALAELQ